MLIIKYKLHSKFNIGTEEEPQWCESFNNIAMPWSEDNEETAKREAYNGEYEIIDDGIEIIEEPTLEEKVDARFAYIEMMTGLLEE